MPEPALRLEGVEKRFAGARAVASIDLEAQQGEFMTLLGPSGCGKTTTLNMIAGFIEPDRGHIYLGGRPVEGLAPFRRDLGIVFQDYALFPHRTVAENVAFGLKMRKVPKPEMARRVAEALQMVRLSGLDERRPLQLSGGQRQRVALARALVIRPTLLLLDEPLSNLDLKLREEMRIEISTLQRRLGIAAVFVTHDQDGALTMSDRIAVLRQGRIEQVARAQEIYERPATEFVASFIGSTNVVRAEVTERREGHLGLSTPHGEAAVRSATALPAGRKVLLTIRPERLKLCLPGRAPAEASAWSARVESVVYLGSRSEIRLRLEDGSLAKAEAVSGETPSWQAGDPAEVWFRAEDAWIIPDAGTAEGERVPVPIPAPTVSPATA